MMMLLIFIAAQAAQAPAMPVQLAPMVEGCALAAREAYRRQDPSIIERYARELLKDKRRNRDKILACAAYVQGVREAASYRAD